ncbi:unnamed protein product, partial [Mesorhabditis belari]|uniref:Calcineurin-binding protein cabin-1 n=1 Tax=Mesorhabditis belari TaxID=2138241 RepID=A0AAF3EN50_9BILA
MDQENGSSSGSDSAMEVDQEQPSTSGIRNEEKDEAVEDESSGLNTESNPGSNQSKSTTDEAEPRSPEKSTKKISEKESSKNDSSSASDEDEDEEEEEGEEGEEEEESDAGNGDEVIELSSSGEENDESNDDEDEDEDESEDREEEDLEDEESDEEDEENEEDESTTDSEDEAAEEEAMAHVWGTTEDPEEIAARSRIEAEENECFKSYTKAVNLMERGHKKTPKRLFLSCLESRVLSQFKDADYDWVYTRQLVNDGVAPKMVRVFVSIHKRLAQLIPSNVDYHYLQVLNVFPKDTKLWFVVGMKMFEKGDLDMALNCFEKVQTPEGIDAYLSTNYLLGYYSACLRICRDILMVDPKNVKAHFIRRKIASEDEFYRKQHNQIFENDELSDVRIEQRLLDAMETRLQTAKEKVFEKRRKEKEKWKISEQPEDIQLEIDEEMDLITVATLFCDLFDRIEAHSSLARQRLIFQPWWERSLRYDIVDTVDFMLDCVESVDEILDEVDHKELNPEELPTSTKYIPKKFQSPKKIYSKGIDIVRRSARKWDIDSASTADEDGIEEGFVENEESDHIFPAAVGFKSGKYPPLRRSGTKRSSRTPTPGNVQPFDSDQMLTEVREALSKSPQGNTIFQCFASLLKILTDFCPSRGCLAKETRHIWIQCYRRFLRMGPSSETDEYLAIHLLFFELGEFEAQGFCQEYLVSNAKWPTIEMAVRFGWQMAKKGNEEARLEKLKIMQDFVPDEVFINTSTGGFSLADIDRACEAVERVHRINSLRSLKESGQHEQIVKVISRDVDFSQLDLEDIWIMTELWMESLRILHKDQEAVVLATRLFTLHRSIEPFLLSKVKELVFDLETIEWSNVGVTERSALGHELANITMITEIVGWWPLWKLIYEVARSIEGPITVEIVEEMLSHGEGDDELPSSALSILIKAHELLGTALCCAQNKGEFLAFFMSQLWSALCVPGVRELLQKSRNSWMLANVCEETVQLLACSFGKYSKKRRNVEEHGNAPKWEPEKLKEVREAAVGLALPYPLPAHDDREKLGHDVIELIQNRLPSMLEVSEERNEIVKRFQKWIKSAEEEESPPSCSESFLQASLYYTVALHYYRQSNHVESSKWATLFLTSGHGNERNPVSHCAWAMLAHTTVYRLFNMSDGEMLENWRWLLLPFRIALRLKPDEGIIHFEHGHSLYQLGTRLTRFLRMLPSNTPLARQAMRDVTEIRAQATTAFEQAIEQPSEQKSDYTWVCFLFLGKLAAKESIEKNILKVLDCFYESACSLELNGSAYPAKIAVKAQKNIGPVEVHYQIYNAAYKYLKSDHTHSREILIGCVSYLKAIQAHGVCRTGNTSLFKTLPETHHIVQELIDQVVSGEQSNEDLRGPLDEMVSKVELIDELWKMCKNGFEICLDRFPHMKAHYRMTQMMLEIGKEKQAHSHLFHGIFKKELGEEGNFIENAIEISMTDLSRSGSFCYHVARALRLAIRLVYKKHDVNQLSIFVSTIVELMLAKDYEWITLADQRQILKECWKAFEACVRREKEEQMKKREDAEIEVISDEPVKMKWTAKLREAMSDILNSFVNLDENTSTPLSSWLNRQATKLITEEYGDVERFAEDLDIEERRQREREAILLAAKRKRAHEMALASQQTLAKSKSDLAPPPAKKPMDFMEQMSQLTAWAQIQNTIAESSTKSISSVFSQPSPSTASPDKTQSSTMALLAKIAASTATSKPQQPAPVSKAVQQIKFKPLGSAVSPSTSTTTKIESAQTTVNKSMPNLVPSTSKPLQAVLKKPQIVGVAAGQVAQKEVTVSKPAAAVQRIQIGPTVVERPKVGSSIGITQKPATEQPATAPKATADMLAKMLALQKQIAAGQMAKPATVTRPQIPIKPRNLLSPTSAIPQRKIGPSQSQKPSTSQLPKLLPGASINDMQRFQALNEMQRAEVLRGLLASKNIAQLAALSDWANKNRAAAKPATALSAPGPSKPAKPQLPTRPPISTARPPSSNMGRPPFGKPLARAAPRPGNPPSPKKPKPTPDIIDID